MLRRQENFADCLASFGHTCKMAFYISFPICMIAQTKAVVSTCAFLNVCKLSAEIYHSEKSRDMQCTRLLDSNLNGDSRQRGQHFVKLH